MSLAQEIGKHLPHFAEGLIVKGFGRGSKQLGKYFLLGPEAQNGYFDPGCFSLS